MAAIEKIRRHSGLLIAIIGIALLAFVLQDLFQSQGRSTGPVVATVDGDKIAVRDFEQQKDKNLENRKAQTGNGNLSSAETYNIYNNTKDEAGNQVCPDFRLTDGHPYYGPNKFVATKAHYTRSVKNDWGTIVLPYKYQVAET